MTPLNAAKSPLPALCRQFEAMPADSFARLSQEDLDVVRCRIEQAWPVRHHRRIEKTSTWLGGLVMAIAFFAIAMQATEPIPMGTHLTMLIGMVLMGIFVGFGAGACVLGVMGTGSLYGAKALLRPLSQMQGTCAQALETLESPSARAYRDAVLDQGRELCYQDLTHMRRLKRVDEDQSWAQRHAQECRALHVSLS